MRTMDRKTFLEMPAGTVFSKYEPYIFGDLSIKGDSLKNDFYYQSLSDALDVDNTLDAVMLLESSQKNKTEVKMDFYCESRDGMYDENQLFAVWSDQDVSQLIKRLEATRKRQEWMFK